MKRILSTTGTYLRMGYLLHLVSIAEIGIISILFVWWRDDWSILKTSIFSILLVFPVFPQLDARSRFQNYKLAKDQLYQFGYKERIIKPFTKSRCQRDAVIMACRQLGHSEICASYFERLGYRWYHLFPDVILNNPLILFNPNFIKSTFFVKTYHPRFDHVNKNSAQQYLANGQKLFTIRNVNKETVSDLSA